jgi:hypothetical protein
VLAAAGGPASSPVGVTPAYAPPNACAGLVRVVAAAGGERYAAWWAPRADSSAHLLAAHSSDGGVTWPHSYVVDSLDRGTRGCRRPAPGPSPPIRPTATCTSPTRSTPPRDPASSTRT